MGKATAKSSGSRRLPGRSKVAWHPASKSLVSFGSFFLLALLCLLPGAPPPSGLAGTTAFAFAAETTSDNAGGLSSLLLFERSTGSNAATTGDAEHGLVHQGDVAAAPGDSHQRGAKLRLTEEGREFLADLRPPFAFVSAVGDTRTGKSTLLANAFLAGDHSVFPTGTGIVSYTRGVHSTRTPILVPHHTHGNVSVYFVDTEGFHGVETLVSKTYEANLFSFMTLLSSTLVYTSVFPMNANDVHRLKSFAALANLFFTFPDLHDKELKQAEQNGGVEFDPISEKSAATRLGMNKRPRLIWAVQNFNMANLANSGRTVSEFLDALLSGTLLGRKDMDLQLLRSMFSHIQLVPIPRPSNDDGVLANMDRLRAAGYLPGYKDALESLSNAALANITPVAFDGRPISGREFLEAFNWWVDGEGLEVEERSTWLSTVLSKLEVSGRGHAQRFRQYAETLLGTCVQRWERQRAATVAEAGSAGGHLPPAMRQERLDVFAGNLTEFRDAEAARLAARIARLGLESSKVPAYAQFAAVDGPNIQQEFEDSYVRLALEEHEHIVDELVSHCKKRLESLLVIRSPAKPRHHDTGMFTNKLEPAATPSMCEHYWLRMTLLSRLEHERQRVLRSFNTITGNKGLPNQGAPKEVTDAQRRRLMSNPTLAALAERIQLEYDSCPNLLLERVIRRPLLAAYAVLAPYGHFLAVTVLLPLLRMTFTYLLPTSVAVFTAFVFIGHVRRTVPQVVRRASAIHRALVEYGITLAVVGGACYALWHYAGGRQVAHGVSRTVASVLDQIEGQLAVVGGLTVLWLFWRSWVKNFT